nr:PREDICTED: serine palmitoyltransferase small subunit A [Opisthocomus hoazin]
MAFLRWARSAWCCMGAAQTQRPRELTVCGSAACLAAAGAPESKRVLIRKHSMLVSIVGMALYTGYVFMPQHIMAILHYFEIVQ